jgi:glutaredoxin
VKSKEREFEAIDLMRFAELTDILRRRKGGSTQVPQLIA